MARYAIIQTVLEIGFPRSDLRMEDGQMDRQFVVVAQAV